MPFEQQRVKTPKSVGTIVILLKDYPANPNTQPPTEAMQTAMIHVNVLDADGQPLTQYSADLLKHIPAAKATMLKEFMTLMRTKASAEVVPVTATLLGRIAAKINPKETQDD